MASDRESPDIISIDADQIQTDSLLAELPAQYELLGKITEGGMGSIFKARNRYTGANVAIKILRSDTSRETDAIKRFYFEAKAASLLKNPNICRLLDFGVTQGGMPYLVMDWIDGISLEKKVANDRRLPFAQAIPIFQQVAIALAHAHQKKLVHRDLKPENIMLSRNSDGQIEVQLVDFGIAKLLGPEAAGISTNRLMQPRDSDSPLGMGLTRVGLAVGTPKYMSPEQAGGKNIDNRADIYALGCVMYFALNGKPPFAASTVIETLKQHVYKAPPAFDPAAKVPAALQKIIYKAMEKDPNKRYASMEELLLQLDALMPRSASQTLPSIPVNPVRKRLSWVIWFIVGFLITYGISLLLQLFAGNSEPTTKPAGVYQSGHK